MQCSRCDVDESSLISSDRHTSDSDKTYLVQPPVSDDPVVSLSSMTSEINFPQTSVSLCIKAVKRKETSRSMDLLAGLQKKLKLSLPQTPRTQTLFNKISPATTTTVGSVISLDQQPGNAGVHNMSPIGQCIGTATGDSPLDLSRTNDDILQPAVVSRNIPIDLTLRRLPPSGTRAKVDQKMVVISTTHQPLSSSTHRMPPSFLPTHLISSLGKKISPVRPYIRDSLSQHTIQERQKICDADLVSQTSITVTREQCPDTSFVTNLHSMSDALDAHEVDLNFSNIRSSELLGMAKNASSTSAITSSCQRLETKINKEALRSRMALIKSHSDQIPARFFKDSVLCSKEKKHSVSTSNSTIVLNIKKEVDDKQMIISQPSAVSNWYEDHWKREPSPVVNVPIYKLNQKQGANSMSGLPTTNYETPQRKTPWTSAGVDVSAQTSRIVGSFSSSTSVVKQGVSGILSGSGLSGTSGGGGTGVDGGGGTAIIGATTERNLPRAEVRPQRITPIVTTDDLCRTMGGCVDDEVFFSTSFSGRHSHSLAPVGTNMKLSCGSNSSLNIPYPASEFSNKYTSTLPLSSINTSLVRTECDLIASQCVSNNLRVAQSTQRSSDLDKKMMLDIASMSTVGTCMSASSTAPNSSTIATSGHWMMHTSVGHCPQVVMNSSNLKNRLKKYSMFHPSTSNRQPRSVTCLSSVTSLDTARMPSSSQTTSIVRVVCSVTPASSDKPTASLSMEPTNRDQPLGLSVQPPSAEAIFESPPSPPPSLPICESPSPSDHIVNVSQSPIMPELTPPQIRNATQLYHDTATSKPSSQSQKFQANDKSVPDKSACLRLFQQHLNISGDNTKLVYPFVNEANSMQCLPTITATDVSQLLTDKSLPNRPTAELVQSFATSNPMPTKKDSSLSTKAATRSLFSVSALDPSNNVSDITSQSSVRHFSSSHLGPLLLPTAEKHTRDVKQAITVPCSSEVDRSVSLIIDDYVEASSSCPCETCQVSVTVPDKKAEQNAPKKSLMAFDICSEFGRKVYETEELLDSSACFDFDRWSDHRRRRNFILSTTYYRSLATALSLPSPTVPTACTPYSVQQLMSYTGSFPQNISSNKRRCASSIESSKSSPVKNELSLCKNDGSTLHSNGIRKALISQVTKPLSLGNKNDSERDGDGSNTTSSDGKPLSRRILSRNRPNRTTQSDRSKEILSSSKMTVGQIKCDVALSHHSRKTLKQADEGDKKGIIVKSEPGCEELSVDEKCQTGESVQIKTEPADSVGSQRRKLKLLRELVSSEGYIAEKKPLPTSDNLFVDASLLSREERALQMALMRITRMEIATEWKNVVQRAKERNNGRKLVFSQEVSSVKTANALKKKALSRGSSKVAADKQRNCPSTNGKNVETVSKDKNRKLLMKGEQSEKSACKMKPPAVKTISSDCVKGMIKEKEDNCNIEKSKANTSNSNKVLSRSGAATHNKNCKLKQLWARNCVKKHSQSRWKVGNDGRQGRMVTSRMCQSLKSATSNTSSKNSSSSRKLINIHSCQRINCSVNLQPLSIEIDPMTSSSLSSLVTSSMSTTSSGSMAAPFSTMSDSITGLSSFDHDVTSLLPDIRIMIPAEVKRLISCHSSGETVLHKAARLGHEDIALWCCQTGYIDVNTRDNAGYMPLHESCLGSHLNIAKYLLHYGAHVDATSRHDGTRPLHEAVDADDIDMVRLLLSAGADINLSTYSGKTVHDLARSKLMKEFIRAYLIDLNGPNDICEAESLWDLAPIWTNSGQSDIGDLLNDAPADDEENDDDDEMLVELSDSPFLDTYNIYHSDKYSHNSSSSGASNNYVLLVDVLQRLSTTRKQFLLDNTDCHVITKLSSHLVSSVNKIADTDVQESSSCNLRTTTIRRLDKKNSYLVELIQLDEQRRQLLEPTASHVTLSRHSITSHIRSPITHVASS